MKRPVVFVLALLAVAVGAYFLFFKKPKPAERQKDQPLAIGENSGSFNQSFDLLLTAYYDLKDGLVASDSVTVNKAAMALTEAADSLKVDELKDSTGVIKATAKDYAGVISGSAKGLAGEQNLEAKLTEFKMISESLWTLLRTVKFTGAKVYYQHCPMAFNNAGANWISKEREIRNPYFGDAMLTCGNTEDSLDYSQK